jgi:hypothetical protein
MRSAYVQLLRTTGMTALSSRPLWDRDELSHDELLAEYERECGIVRRGIDGDLTKVRRLILTLTSISMLKHMAKDGSEVVLCGRCHINVAPPGVH